MSKRKGVQNGTNWNKEIRQAERKIDRQGITKTERLPNGLKERENILLYACLTIRQKTREVTLSVRMYAFCSPPPIQCHLMALLERASDET